MNRYAIPFVVSSFMMFTCTNNSWACIYSLTQMETRYGQFIPKLAAAVIHGEMVRVKELLHEGVNPNEPGECEVLILSAKPYHEIHSNAYALHVAAREGFIEIIKLLITAGANVDAEMPIETKILRPIHFAKTVEVAKLLKDSGANVFVSACNLLCAVEANNSIQVQALLNRYAQNEEVINADIIQKSLDLALKLGLIKIAELIKDAEKQRSLLQLYSDRFEKLQHAINSNDITHAKEILELVPLLPKEELELMLKYGNLPEIFAELIKEFIEKYDGTPDHVLEQTNNKSHHE